MTPGRTFDPPEPGAREEELQSLQDISKGVRLWEIWGTLAWHDIVARYRRSMLGPWWLTLSAAVFISFLGFLYSRIMGQPADEYVPHLAIGYIVWITLSTNLIEGCRAFVDYENIILQRDLPFSLHVYRCVWRNMLIFAHNVGILIPISIYFGINPGWHLLIVPVGLAILFVNSMWMALLLGIVSARYRDIPPLITTLVQLAFFMTPVMWLPESLAGYQAVIDANLFYHLIELIRAPLLESTPKPLTWAMVGIFTVLGWTVTVAVFERTRHQIVYWL